MLLPSGQVAITCQIVEEGDTFQVANGSQTVQATLVTEDRGLDICLFQVQGLAGKAVQMGSTAGLAMGSSVYCAAVGKDSKTVVTEAYVMQMRGGSQPLIQLSTTAPEVSSGGLFDQEGRFIGLTGMYTKNGQQFVFATPAEWFEALKPGRKPSTAGPGHAGWIKGSVALEQAGDWKAMVDWCQQWSKDEPADSSVWHCLGYGYLNQKLFEEALAAYRQTVQINPDDADGWSNLGFVFTDLKRYEEAIQAYRQTVRINPDDTEAWVSLGYAYFSTGNQAAVQQVAEQLQRLNPGKAKEFQQLITPR